MINYYNLGFFIIVFNQIFQHIFIHNHNLLEFIKNI